MLPLLQLLLSPSPAPPRPVSLELVEEPELGPHPRELPRLARRLRPAPRRRPRTRQRPPEQRKTPTPKANKRKEREIRPQPPQPPRLKMVEVQDPGREAAPKNARYLSDKNRRVERETRARHTNRQKAAPTPRPVPSRSKQPAKRAGAKKTRAARPRPPEERPRKRPKVIHGERLSPRLAMRQRRAQEAIRELAPSADHGALRAPQRAQEAQSAQRARRGRRPKLDLDQGALDRIVGPEAKRQRELARLKPSPRRGGTIARKWKRVRAALENYIPEVQPGNQTALSTRANPFAIYIARMHRKIHPLWGHGFLIDLDNKSDRHPLNEMKLRVTMEIAVNPDGSVAKATIVRPSGQLVYDVAAMETIFSGGPYDPTPKMIRSADGKVYLHWSFYRNHRQCGTFNVRPYILTTPPEGPVDGTKALLPKPDRRVRRLNRRSPIAAGATRYRPGPATPSRRRLPPQVDHRRLSATQRRQRLRAARAAARRHVDAEDPAARARAWRLLRAFRAGDAEAMARACALPFRARGTIVARTRAELERMFANLLREARSRRLGALKLMTTFEARRRLGALPRGVRHGQQLLVGRVRLGERMFTMTLQRRRGSWRIRALELR